MSNLEYSATIAFYNQVLNSAVLPVEALALDSPSALGQALGTVTEENPCENMQGAFDKEMRLNAAFLVRPHEKIVYLERLKAFFESANLALANARTCISDSIAIVDSELARHQREQRAKHIDKDVGSSSNEILSLLESNVKDLCKLPFNYGHFTQIANRKGLYIGKELPPYHKAIIGAMAHALIESGAVKKIAIKELSIVIANLFGADTEAIRNYKRRPAKAGRSHYAHVFNTVFSFCDNVVSPAL